MSMNMKEIESKIEANDRAFDTCGDSFITLFQDICQLEERAESAEGRIEALEKRVSRIESRPLPRKVSRDFAGFDARLDAVAKHVAALEARLSTELQDRGDSYNASFNAWYDQKNKAEALEKRLAALEEAHKVGAHNAAELYDATDRKADDARAEISELRARVEDLEDWMLAAKKGCSTLGRIPFPVSDARAAQEKKGGAA